MLSMEPLHALIKAMTKTEKRYFRLTADMQKRKDNKDYLALFDMLDHEDTYSHALTKKIQTHFPGKQVEPARKHLYHVIMKSLRQFEGDKDIDMRLANLLQESKILYQKGLVGASLSLIEKTKNISLAYERFSYFVVAAKQEILCLIRTQFAGIDETTLVQKQEKIREFLEEQTNAAQHAMLYEVLLLRYWKNGVVRSQKEITSMNDLILEEYQFISSRRIKSFESRQLHLQFQSVYFLISGNPEGSLSIFRDLDNLFEVNRHLWEDNPTHYINFIDEVLHNLRAIEKYNELNFYFDRLRSLTPSSHHLSLVIKYVILSHQLHSACDRHEYPEANCIIGNKSLLEEKEIQQLPINLQTNTYLALARTYFGLGQYSTVLKIANGVLNKLAGSSQSNYSLFIIFNLMHLQVNILLKNADYLFYAIRSLERKLKLEKKVYGVEQLMLKIAKACVSNKPLTGFEQDLNAVEKNPLENYFVKILSLKTWVSKISGTRAKNIKK